MAESRMNDAVARTMDALDRSVLRELQRGGYVCSAKCFDHKSWSTEQLQQCVERCQMPMQQVQGYLQQELSAFQNRLQRCAMDCQDRARDTLPAAGQPSDAQLEGAQKSMESCVGSCVDSHIKLLPALHKRVEEAVKQVKQQQP